MKMEENEMQRTDPIPVCVNKYLIAYRKVPAYFMTLMF